MGRGVNAEVWVYPLKVLHDLRLEMKYGDYPEYEDATRGYRGWRYYRMR